MRRRSPFSPSRKASFSVPLLELRDLEKCFRAPDGETTPVLAIDAFTLDEGEQVALEGGSGTGKTTLLNVIAGLVTPDRGQVVFDGRDLTRLKASLRDRHRAEHIGTIFQSFHLLPGFTALENVVLGMLFSSEVDRSHARELLVRLGLEDRLHYRPRQLSIGQQQRVALARAMANRPKLVLADEPTGNLDRENAETALAIIRDICAEQGAALLLVSHDPHVLGAFDRRVELRTLNRALATAEELGR